MRTRELLSSKRRLDDRHGAADRSIEPSDCGVSNKNQPKIKNRVKLIAFFCIIFCWNANAQSFIFKNISVVNTGQNSISKNQNVLIKEGIIQNIGSRLKTPNGYVEIDGTGKFLMAGLADMHAHFPDPNRDMISTKHFLLLQLMAGITTVRSMRGKMSDIALRDSVRNESLLSPDLYLSAPPIYSSNKVSPDSIGLLVSDYNNSGFDFIKILSLPNSPQFYDSLLAASKRYGIPIVGHAPWGDAAIAIENNQRSIEHLQGYARFKGDTLNEVIKKTKLNNIYNCPTLDWTFIGSLYYTTDKLKGRAGMQYLPLALREKWEKTLVDYLGKVTQNEKAKDSLSLLSQLDLMKKLKAADCEFLISQDASNVFQVPGFGLLEEMKLFKKAGFSNQEILDIATQSSVRFLGKSESMGKVEAGFKANLIMLGGNPLEDLENLRKVDGVMLRKQWLTSAFMEEQVQTYLK